MDKITSGLNKIISELNGQNILILGFGREGRSSYSFLQQHVPDANIAVADANTTLETEKYPMVRQWHLGPDYLQAISQYDLVLQSPGVCLKSLFPTLDTSRITSQTDLFLQAFGSQSIGVTGTKGKSTTSSLIRHLLQETGHETLFGGNIGIPLFELIPQINARSRIVMELSCHQLEFARHSPHIALLLNLFEEHLDHYTDYNAYQLAKYNIARNQRAEDLFLYPKGNELIENLMEKHPLASQIIAFSEEDFGDLLQSTNFPLKGAHNRLNAAAALSAAQKCDPQTSMADWTTALYSFQSLPHRMEYVGCFDGVTYYNDSISTIPQAAIAAVKAIGNVDTLLLGGMDRGIDYTPLKELFAYSSVRNFLFTGAAGRRMLGIAQETDPHDKHFAFFENFADMVDEAKKCTCKGMVCLLSPAAPSYDAFKNFEERGEVFKGLLKKSI